MNFYSKNNLYLSIRDESILNKEHPVFRMIYKLPKDIFGCEKIDLSTIVYFFNDPLKWNKNIKSIKIVNQINDVKVNYICYKKLLFNLLERESLEKSISFIENSVYYSFSSSIEENDCCKCEKNFNRILTYIKGYKIYEEKDSYVFQGIFQFNIKTPISNNFLSHTLPIKIHSLFDNFVETVKDELL